MQITLQNGYTLWITKMGKNKRFTLLLSTEPNKNEFTKIGLIDDLISVKKIYTAFTTGEQWQV